MRGEVEGGGRDNNACQRLYPFEPSLIQHTDISAAYPIVGSSVTRHSIHIPKMNSLNALGNRQISSLQADLAKMENGESGPSVQGESHSGQGIDLSSSKEFELTDRGYHDDIRCIIEID